MDKFALLKTAVRQFFVKGNYEITGSGNKGQRHEISVTRSEGEKTAEEWDMPDLVFPVINKSYAVSTLLHLAIICTLTLATCKTKVEAETDTLWTADRIIREISYNDISVDVVINKPPKKEVNVLIVYHGTVLYDRLIVEAAHNILDKFLNLLIDDSDIMMVSVAYPEENLLLGDNIKQAEAALLWVKNRAGQELNIQIGKIFLAGHSQGGYLVTRLNTMHETEGVIANAPGPLNLVFRCQLEENGKIPDGIACTLLKNAYGSTSANPEAYDQRSLLNFTNGFKSDILFIQGLNDGPVHMYSWPLFKQQIMDCPDCRGVQFLELPGFGHNALFVSPVAKEEFNNFLKNR